MTQSHEPLSPIDQLIEEYLDQGRGTDALAIEDYCQSHPHLAEQILHLFPMIGLLEDVAGNATLVSWGGSSDTATEYPSEHRELVPPTTLGRYAIQRVLGRGGMGTVYLARDTELGRQVALKIPRLEHSATAAERFRREARAMASLKHANLCPIYDVGRIDGVNFLCMAYVEGEALDQVLSDAGPLDELKAVGLIRQVAKGLAAVHDAGIIHRDIKPSNIIVATDGTPILMDFGLARHAIDLDAELTREGEIVGSPAYLAPEQIESELGEVGPASDVYALGIVLFELVTGRRPFAGSTLRVLGRVVTEEPPNPSSVTAGTSMALDQLCQDALRRMPENRISSAVELANRLDSWPTKPAQRRKAITPLLLAGALLLFTAFIVTIRTPVGEIAVRVPDGLDARVHVLNSGELIDIIGPQNDWRVKLRRGHYDVQLSSSDRSVELSTDSVEVTRGQTTELEVKIGDSDAERPRRTKQSFFAADGSFSQVVRAIATGDLDGDGDMDAFAARFDAKLAVMLNDGQGNLVDGPDVPDPDAWRNWEIALGDIDLDGDLDAFVTKNGPDRLWLNDGNARFTACNFAFGEAESNQVALGDVDGDQMLDIVVAQCGQLSVWCQSDSTSIEFLHRSFGEANYYSCALGDLDSDGDLDLVVGTVDGARNEVWLNDGNGDFRDSGQQLGVYETWDLQLIDLDGDRDLDAVLANANGPIEIFQNDGDATFGRMESSPAVFETHGVRVADFDRDGDLDIFESTNGESNPDILWLSQGSKRFMKRIQLPSIAAERCAIGYFDSDERVDILGNRIWLNRLTDTNDVESL